MIVKRSYAVDLGGISGTAQRRAPPCSGHRGGQGWTATAKERCPPVANEHPGGPASAVSERGFIQALGLFPATALNMAQMVGIGPFITIPLIISAMGGPQAILGWIVGAIIALLDGLVWAELGAAMPRSGGTYTILPA